MLRVQVYFDIKAEYRDEFKKASLENATNSRNEVGVIRFEVLQQEDDLTKFSFIEIYKEQEDQLKHRGTAHFKKWREAIDKMLAKPYTFTKYIEI